MELAERRSPLHGRDHSHVMRRIIDGNRVTVNARTVGPNLPINCTACTSRFCESRGTRSVAFDRFTIATIDDTTRRESSSLRSVTRRDATRRRGINYYRNDKCAFVSFSFTLFTILTVRDQTHRNVRTIRLYFQGVSRDWK